MTQLLPLNLEFKSVNHKVKQHVHSHHPIMTSVRMPDGLAMGKSVEVWLTLRQVSFVSVMMSLLPSFHCLMFGIDLMVLENGKQLQLGLSILASIVPFMLDCATT